MKDYCEFNLTHKNFMLMKKLRMVLFVTLTSCSLLSSCKKDNARGEQLPPATQIGANTFGCLINGKVFIPKGYTNPYPNYRVFVDPGYNNNFDIRTYSYQNNVETDVGFSSFGIDAIGYYVVQNGGLIYPDSRQNINSEVCNFTSSTNNYKNGFLKITRFDLQAGVIAGEFEWNLFDSTISCDTIRITRGRFDTKF